MEIIYSAQKRDFEPGRRYANPKYFDMVRREAKRVVIVGHYPEIADAYRRAKIKVIEIEPGEPLPGAIAFEPTAQEPKRHAATEPNAPDNPTYPGHNFQMETAKHGAARPGEGDGLDYAGPAPIGGTADYRAAVGGARAARDVETTGRQGYDADAAIPDNWRNLHWQKQRQLARALSGHEIANLQEAEEAIETVIIERRGGPVRVSARSDDPGNLAWLELTQGGGRSVKVYLDGKLVEEPVTADEREGVVYVIDPDAPEDAGEVLKELKGRVFVDVI